MLHGTVDLLLLTYGDTLNYKYDSFLIFESIYKIEPDDIDSLLSYWLEWKCSWQQVCHLSNADYYTVYFRLSAPRRGAWAWCVQIGHMPWSILGIIYGGLRHVGLLSNIRRSVFDTYLIRFCGKLRFSIGTGGSLVWESTKSSSCEVESEETRPIVYEMSQVETWRATTWLVMLGIDWRVYEATALNCS